MKKYIAYYRVSTQRQGESGLGLQAQKELVSRWDISEEYQDIETGKSSTRPNLLKAIQRCKETGATLIIAKLDRLARNAKFIFTLKESGVKFICADMPEANNLTIGLLAVIAEDEASRISTRTKDALGQIKSTLKSKGTYTSKSGNKIKSLGSPENLSQEARLKGSQAMKTKYENHPANVRATALIKVLREAGKTFEEIANELNKSGFKTVRGCEFKATQVKRLFDRNGKQ